MNSRILTIPKLPRSRRLKNWLHVNIGAAEAKQLRALAECFGMDLRCFLTIAVRAYKAKLADQIKREFGVESWEVDKISAGRRRAIGVARREIWNACKDCGVFRPDRN